MEIYILIGFFIFISVLFIVGMFLYPELFGISKKSTSDNNDVADSKKN